MKLKQKHENTKTAFNNITKLDVIKVYLIE